MRRFDLALRVQIGCALALLGACGGGSDGNSPPPLPPTYTVGGSVSGLGGTVVLQNNGGDDISVAQNGTFAFPTALASGGTYNITVKAQPDPPSQTCSVTNGTGTVSGTDITSVTVQCITNKFPVGGSLNGLLGTGLVLEQSGGDDLSLSADGSFHFATSVASGQPYNVTVKTQPNNPSETCSVSAASGAVTDTAVSSVVVTCVVNSFSVGGTVTGLAGTGLVLEDNSGDDLSVAPSGAAFTFATAIASGKTYSVSVKTQPGNPAQTCLVTSGSGTVGGSAVTSVHVVCTTNALACGQENGTVVTHTNSVTASETWAGAGTVHLVQNDITIYAPAAVTIAPCAIVKLAGGVEITIRGDGVNLKSAQLIAAGTDPVDGAVYFIAADTQKPWSRLDGVDLSSYLELNNAVIKNGGATGGSDLNAVIDMAGGSAQSGNSVLPDPVLKVVNVTIDANDNSGIYLGSSSRFTDDSKNLTIQNSAGYPVAMRAMALAAMPSATFTNNGKDSILVVENSDIYDDLTISTTIPIDFTTSVWVIANGAYGLDKHQVTLTLKPGVTWRFLNTTSESDLITFGDDSAPSHALAHIGTLIAQGTADAPITFTSSAATPAPADWAGLWLAEADGSQLDHVIVEYAGAEAGLVLEDCAPLNGNNAWPNSAAILVGNNQTGYVPPSNIITNSTLRNNGGSFAIDSVWNSTSFGPDLTQTNTITASSKSCVQPRNILNPQNSCSVNGQDMRGCLVQ